MKIRLNYIIYTFFPKLFSLANVLKPGSIKKINESKMAFKMVLGYQTNNTHRHISQFQVFILGGITALSF